MSSQVFGMKGDILTCHLIDSIFLNSEPLALSFNPQGNKLAAGLCNGQVAFVSLDGEKPTVDYVKDSEGTVKSVNWSPNGKFFASDFRVKVNKNKEIYGVSIWNDKCFMSVFLPFFQSNIWCIYDVAWNNSGDLLAVNFQYCKSKSTTNNIIIVSRDGNFKKELSASGPIKGLAWHSTKQGDTILAYTIDNIVYTTNVYNDQPKVIWKFEKEKGDKGTKEIKKITWSPDGKKLAIGINMGSEDGRIHILAPSLDGNGETKKLYEFKRNRMLMNFSWGPKDFLVASFLSYSDSDYYQNEKDPIVFYDTKTGNVVGTGKTKSVWPERLAWSGNGALLAIGDDDTAQCLKDKRLPRVEFYKVVFNNAQEKLNILDQDKK